MRGILQGRSVLVTGAAQPDSIGEAIARRAAQEGARVVVTSRRADDAQAGARRLKAEGLDVDGVACDITSEASVADAVDAMLRSHGRVDGVVHNAGAPVGLWERDLVSVPVADFARVFDVDVLGALRLTQRLLPAMRAQGGGSVVFTSSTPALAGYEHLHEFSPAKAGVLGLMRGLAAEAGTGAVRSNAVAYGNIATPATLAALDEKAKAQLAMESPMRRWGTPRDAAGACVFLLSDLAAFVNGQVVVVDGGTVMR